MQVLCMFLLTEVNRFLEDNSALVDTKTLYDMSSVVVVMIMHNIEHTFLHSRHLKETQHVVPCIMPHLLLVYGT